MMPDEKEAPAISRMTKTAPAVETLLEAIRATLDNDKALDVVVIPMAGKSAIADYMVVASGTSKRHVGAMAGHIVEAAEKLNVPGVAVEGAVHCDWVLIDIGDVLVHLFRPEVRDFYALERLWGEAAVSGNRTARGQPAVAG